MMRVPARLCALVITVLLPSVAFAQKEPPHTKETKDAEKFIGLALTRQDPAQKRQYLEQALPPLREAMQKNPENGRVWALAGGVFSGLGQFAAADSAYDKAVQLHAGYAEQIENERHAAWETAFNQAVVLINEQKIDEGIVALELAELMYRNRPEAKYYLGVFYSQKKELDKAKQAFESAIATVQGPLRAQLQPAGVAEWDRMAVEAKVKLSDIIGFQGIEFYNTEKFDSAAAYFARAREINPSSHDHLFNHVQAAYSGALETIKAEESSNDNAKALFENAIALTDSLKSVYPRNEAIFSIPLQSHKALGEMTNDKAVKARHADAMNDIAAAYQKTEYFVGDLQLAVADSSVTAKGEIRNNLLKAGATGTVVFELLGPDGSVVGSAPLTFTVPAGADKSTTIPFSLEIPLNGSFAGLRYK